MSHWLVMFSEIIEQCKCVYVSFKGSTKLIPYFTSGESNSDYPKEYCLPFFNSTYSNEVYVDIMS